MKKASSRLIGRKNFSLFAKEAHSYRDTVRNVMNIGIKKRNSFIYIDIEANGFLRNMARNIVSFLVKVGEGKIKVQNISGIIKGKLSYINKPAPSSGLYLWKVKYE
jgi:tRNA pseudouridine38-40 synthase